MIKKTEEIYSKYAVYFNYRTADNPENTGKNFMFQDYQFYYMIDGNYNINSLIGEVMGFINWFQGTICILAVNYKQIKDKQYKKDKKYIEFTFEQAVRSVVSEFQLDNNYKKYLVSQILSVYYKHKNEHFSDTIFDRSVYEKNFRYYFFEDNFSHDMQTKIIMQSFNDTPEKILLRICEKAKVIGMSATATVPTVIGNFDLEYLENKMGSNYHTVSGEDFSRLSKEFTESQSGYDNIKIHSELIGTSGYSVETWENIISDSVK
ncbi:MAG: hypothetical protein HDT23_03510 [Ruminococcus sp.]|nr:hypothetical protein [Ruminococcus sp.]